MLFEDESETETESEYMDARETEVTPLSSVQDFHSIQSRDSEESDTSSLRTSVATDRRTTATILPASMRGRINSYATMRESDRPVLKDTAMQTDEWVPSASAGGLARVAGQSAPFQFVPGSPARNTPASLALAASIVRSPMRETTNTSAAAKQASRLRTSSISSFGEVKGEPDDMGSLDHSMTGSFIDRSRPPTMNLPPPPSMPPPTALPSRRSMAPPPRPTSPPPPELLQRATTPTFGRQNSLMVPGSRGPRQSLGAAPPSAMASAGPSSTLRSRAASRSGSMRSLHAGLDGRDERKIASQLSLNAGGDMPHLQRRHSMASSQSSEKMGIPATPSTPTGALGGSTDPAVINAITQTMIGEYLYKYTRRVVGKGHGEKRHKRFFWIHPYTKTLYWSSNDPGSSNTGESNAKSAYIDAVKSIIDPNPLPPGLHQYSIIVYTPQREMKFTAPTKERHDIWLKALSYLLDRPSATGNGSTPSRSIPPSPLATRTRVAEDGTLHPSNGVMQSPASVRSAMSNDSIDSWNITPRGTKASRYTSPSMGRRTGTPAAEYMRTYPDRSFRPYPDVASPDRAAKSLQQRFEEALNNPEEEDSFDGIEIQNGGEFEMFPEDEFEGLENVRACCDGEHDLSNLSGKHDHHHHHHQHSRLPPVVSNRSTSRLSNRPEPPAIPTSRPASPAPSKRSRSGSQRSEGGMFSRSLRFGSRRSAKSSTMT